MLENPETGCNRTTERASLLSRSGQRGEAISVESSVTCYTWATHTTARGSHLQRSRENLLPRRLPEPKLPFPSEDLGLVLSLLPDVPRLFDWGRYLAFLPMTTADPTPAPTTRPIIAPMVLKAARTATR